MCDIQRFILSGLSDFWDETLQAVIVFDLSTWPEIAATSDAFDHLL